MGSLSTSRFSSKNNGLSGFVSSGIIKDAEWSQEKILETAKILREKYGFTGYLHLKVLPDTPMENEPECPGWRIKEALSGGQAHQNLRIQTP